MLSGGTCSACAIAGTAVFKIVVSSASMKKPTATSQGSSRLAVGLGTLSLGACPGIDDCNWCAALRSAQGGIHDDLRLPQDAAQMRVVAKALGVYLVDVFGSR